MFSVKAKIVLIGAAALCVFMLGAYSAFHFEIEQTFKSLERQLVNESLGKMQSSIDLERGGLKERVQQLVITASPPPIVISANKRGDTSSLPLLEGEIAFLLDSSGTLSSTVAGPRTTPVQITDALAAAAGTARAEGAEIFSSMLLSEEQVYFAASAPIPAVGAAEKTGGFLLLLRRANLEALSARAALVNLKVFPAVIERLPSEARSQFAVVQRSNSVAYYADAQSRFAFKTIADFEGNPVLLLEAKMRPAAAAELANGLLSRLIFVSGAFGAILCAVLLLAGPAILSRETISFRELREFASETGLTAAMEVRAINLKAAFRDFRAQLMERTRVFREREQRTKELSEQLHHKAEERQLFLSELSRVLRTPLNSILGLVDLVLDAAPPVTIEEPLLQVSQEAHEMQQVITNATFFCELESGRIEINREPFNLKELVLECLEPSRAAAARAQVSLRAELAKDVPAKVVGDFRLLRQVLINLVAHNLQFAAAKCTVAIVVEQVESLKGGARLRFSVVDHQPQSGKTFDPNRLAIGLGAFKPKDFHTQGMNFALACRLVERLGGKLEMRQRDGAGRAAVFKLVFDLEAPALVQSDAATSEEGKASDWLPVTKEQFPAATQHKEPEGLRILVVEDNEVNRALLDRLLKKRGFEVECVEGGREALARAERGSFDLIFMDCELPDVDGFETTRKIRLGERKSGKHVPIVALTALAMGGDEERCLLAGMDDYLPKPIDKGDLSRVLARYLGVPETPSSAQKSPAGEG